MELKKTEAKNILVRLPVPLVKKLDRAARQHGRSRTSEVTLRLSETFQRKSTDGAT
jgi:hypothetical protein